MGYVAATRLLLGRRHELSTIAAALDNAAGGTLRAVVVEGEAGIGKTRLLAAAVEEARQRGFSVVEALPHSGTAPETSGSSDPAEPRHDDPGQVSRFRLVEGALERVEAVAVSDPVVVALDDLQWADRATLLTVRAMAVRMRHLPVALLLALRSGADSGAADEVVQELITSSATHLRLPPLTSDALRDLVTAEIGARPGRRLRRLLEEVGGNPLYALELVRSLDADGVLEVERGKAVPRTSAPPPSLQAAILRRLRHYGPDAMQALQLGAVLGTSFTLTDLAIALDRSAVRLLRDLDRPIRGGILGERDGALAFRHPLLRQAVYLEMPRTVRTALHLEAGRRLAAAGRPAQHVAPHLAVGAPRGDTDAVDWLRRGASEAMTTNPAEAVRLLRRALELAVPGDETHSQAAASLVGGLGWAGQPSEAESVAHGALQDAPDPRARARVRASLAGVLRLYGHFGASLEHAEAALAEDDVDWSVQVVLLGDTALAQLFLGELAEVEKLVAATGQGTHTANPFAVAAGAWIAALRGQPERAYDAALAAATAAERSGSPTAFRPLPMLGFAWDRVDRTAEAEEFLAKKLLRVEERGTVHDVAWYQCVLGLLRFHLGRWDDAKLDLDGGLGLADELGVPPLGGSLWSFAVRAQIATHEGDLRTAAAVLERATRPTDARLGLDWMRLAQATLHEAGGNPVQALSTLVDGWELETRFGFRSEQPLLGPDLVRLAVAQRRVDLAREVTDALADIAGEIGTGTARAAAVRCRGLLDGDPDTMLEAVAAAESVARPLPLAAVSEDAGRICAAADRTEQGKALLLRAREGYTSLGAHHDRDRVDAALRALGVRHGVRGSRSRPEGGPTNLTRRERDIATLVAEGLTNRDIAERLYVSPRTVGTHVSNILTKLGLRSRVELAVETTHSVTPRTSGGRGHASPGV